MNRACSGRSELRPTYAGQSAAVVAVRLVLIAAVWVLCVILHNAIYAMLRDSFGPDWDEPFFLILAVVVIPIYFVVSLVYTIVQLVRYRG